MFWLARSSVDPHEQVTEAENEIEVLKLVGTGRFELPTPRTPSECSTRLSHVPTTVKQGSCSEECIKDSISVAEAAAEKQQIPPLRFAPVGMTIAELPGGFS